MGDRGFLGTGWAFPPVFDSRTKQASMVSEAQDIAQSLHILLGTKPGERVMQPTFGCGLDRMVFELIDESTITEIRDIIEKAVLFFEPRITLDAVEVDTGRLFEGVLLLNLAYTVRSTNTRSNLVYPLYLREGTDVGHEA
jgi:phage baseplate assembly protein W